MADGRRGLWWTDRLWALSADLPVEQVKLSEIGEFDLDCWFQDRHVPSVRNVAEHARRIFDADLAYPVIICAEGRLMDGGHRLAKAWMEGREEIAAVRFRQTPEPDEIL
ncbi:MAG: chromosome partitioning protein ParB [Phenylobacterium sp.]|nr:chromosome partitioning protein ParB [Phenylobacterium sp.]